MREVRRRWRAASTRARCVSHASLSSFSFSRKKTYARKTTMPRRPRTRGRIFDARARLCAAKIHAPNINQRCPTPWIQLTCLVGTVTVCRATKDDKKHPSRVERDARRSAFFFRVGSFFFFRVRPYPGRQRRTPRPARPKLCARSTTVRFVLQTETLRVRALCLFTRLYYLRACLPRCWVAERSAVTRSVQVLRSERAFATLIEADPSASR